MRSWRIRAACAVACAGACAFGARPLRAQDAIVLGGGGARGLAHAGVLVGIDSLGYQPGIVVGASMGSIVGALYAAGYDAREVWRLMESQNWFEVFTPFPMALGPDHASLRPAARFGFAIDHGRYQEGIVPDWRINRELVRLLFDAAARARGDFDRLPRRYRAVAADIASGEQVVLGDGDLALAVRASMAVPAVFASVRREDRILVDGGLANYLPISVARHMGARDAIAVDVIRPPKLDSPPGIIATATRALRLELLNTIRDSLEVDRMLIPPIPPERSSAAFPRRADRLMKIGLDAALRDLPRAPAGAEPPPPAANPPARIDALIIEAPEPGLERMVAAAFEPLVPGPYDAAAVLSAADHLYASGLFNGVWPHIEQRAAGADTTTLLLVHVEATQPTSIAGGVGYDNDRGGRAWLSLGHRIEGPAPIELALSGSIVSTDGWASASARIGLPTLPAFGIIAGGGYRETDVRTFDDGHRAGEVEVRHAGGWLGVDWRNVAPEMYAVLALHAEAVDPGPGASGSSIGPYLRFGTIYPAAFVVGGPTAFEAELRTGDVSWRRGRLQAALPWNVGRLLFAVVGDVTAVTEDAPADALPALGDDHALPGLGWGEGRTPTRALAGLDAAWPAFFGGFARIRLRTGAAARTLDALSDVRWNAGAEGALTWWTPLGSVTFDAGVTRDGDWRLNLNVGTAF